MCVRPDVMREVSQWRKCCRCHGSHSEDAYRGTSGGTHPNRSQLVSAEKDKVCMCKNE